MRELPARRGQGYCTATVRILLIEDDKQAARWLSKGLQEERFVVEVAYTGPGGSKLGRGDILDNAVKFSPHGGHVCVSVSRASETSATCAPCAASRVRGGR